MQQLNIHTVKVCLYLPTRYEDNTVIDLNQAEDQSNVTIEGQVYTAPVVAFFGRNKSKLTVHLMHHLLSNVFFYNQPYLKKKIELNQTITVKGKWNRVKQEITGNRVFFNSQEHKLKKTQMFNSNQSIVLRKVLNKSKYETKLDKR